MADVAGDVPSKYDVVITDGVTTQGFVLHDPFRSDANIPQKAIHSFSPTFIPRTNIEGNYGDDSQDFWMTSSQRDWSLGEDQRNAIDEAQDRNRRYWRGTAVDVTTPGRVSLRETVRTVTTAATLLKVLARPDSSHSNSFIGVSSTNLYTYNDSGTETNVGAHGMGAAPETLAFDGGNVFIGSLNVGTAGVRKWDGSAFTTFSATGASHLAFLNNTLYGFRRTAGTLVRYDTAGAATVIHTWQEADGTALATRVAHIIPYGGKLLIMFSPRGTAEGSELWIYDGVGVSLLHKWNPALSFQSLSIVQGIVFIGGALSMAAGGSTIRRNIVYAYANGTVTVLWADPVGFTANSQGVAITPFIDGMLIAAQQSSSSTRILFWNPATGGVHTVADIDNDISDVSANQTGAMFSDQASTSLYIYPSGTTATSGYVQSSLIDFDSSLSKIFRGVKVDYEDASDGNGGTVDIAYRVDDLGATNRRNLITNGDFRTLTGWTAAGSSIAQSSGGKFGPYTLSVTTNNAAANEGVSSPTAVATLGETFTASVYVKGTGGTVRLKLQGVDDPITAETESFFSSPVTLTAAWQRLTITGTIASASTELVRLIPQTNVQQGIQFYCSGAQLEESSAVTDFESEGYTFVAGQAEPETEYNLGTTSGRSISIKILLNKSTSTRGPVLRRIYLRAVPKVNSFHRSRVVLSLHGRNGESPIALRDGSHCSKDGQELAEILEEFAMHDGLLTVTDKFGSRTSVIETMELSEIRPEEYVAEATFREV